MNNCMQTRIKPAPKTPATLPIPEGYSLLPPGELLETGDKWYCVTAKQFFATLRAGLEQHPGRCYIRPIKMRTVCCNYAARIDNYPVYYNPGNNVVQCHNCGHIYIPVAVRLSIG